MAQFDTTLVPHDDRVEYWRSVISHTFVPLSCEFNDPQRLASLSSAVVGDVGIAQVSCAGQKVTRSQRVIDDHPSDNVLISFMREGSTAISQGYRSAIVRKGGFGLYDTRRPYDLHINEASSQFVVQLPRALLQNQIGDIDKLTAHSFGQQHPMGQFTQAFLDNLLSLPDDVPAHYLDSLSIQVTSLIINMISDECRRSVYRPDTKQGLTAQIKLYVQQCITDPELTGDVVAKKFGISTRYLRMLFQIEHTTFGRFVLQSRLENCKTALQSEHNQDKLLGDVAWSCGFHDMSYFSREFKKYFDISPRDYRQSIAPKNSSMLP